MAVAVLVLLVAQAHTCTQRVQVESESRTALRVLVFGTLVAEVEVPMVLEVRVVELQAQAIRWLLPMQPIIQAVEEGVVRGPKARETADRG